VRSGRAVRERRGLALGQHRMGEWTTIDCSARGTRPALPAIYRARRPPRKNQEHPRNKKSIMSGGGVAKRCTEIRDGGRRIRSAQLELHDAEFFLSVMEHVSKITEDVLPASGGARYTKRAGILLSAFFNRRMCLQACHLRATENQVNEERKKMPRSQFCRPPPEK